MKVLTLLSGGVDSTVALAVARASSTFGRTCERAVSFDYGQTHIRELESARAVASHYGIEHHVIDLTAVLRGPSALTGTGVIPTAPATEPDATFVPGRNLVMIAAAVSLAQTYGETAVVIGANADDNAGYPDCRPSFMESLDGATRAGYRVGVWAPLVRLPKSEVFRWGRELGAPLHLTWSCYRGGVQPCGSCGACLTRLAAEL